MRAVVLEIRSGKAAVLREDGTVLKVHGNYAVGDTIELKERSLSLINLRTLAMTAVLVIALLLGGYNYTTVQAAGYIETDEDTGIQLVLNRRDQVIDIIASNAYGEELKEELLKEHIKGSDIVIAVHAVAEYHRINNDESQELTFHAVTKNDKNTERINKKLDEMRRPIHSDMNEIQEQTQFPEEIKQERQNNIEQGRPEFNEENRPDFEYDGIQEEEIKEEHKEFNPFQGQQNGMEEMRGENPEERQDN